MHDAYVFITPQLPVHIYRNEDLRIFYVYHVNLVSVKDKIILSEYNPIRNTTKIDYYLCTKEPHL